MTCRTLEHLWRTSLPGELPPAAVAHLAACPACRALVQTDTDTDAFLRRMRAVRPSVSVGPAREALHRALDERVRHGSRIAPPWPVTLPAALTTLVTAGDGRRGKPLAIARALSVAALVLLLVIAAPWREGRTGAAAVEAAVERANTWHLVGWKLVPGPLGRGQRRVPWEIWGRRSPFFYREQLGDGLSFDDGQQRIRIVQGWRVVQGRPSLRLYALRLESGPAPTDAWRSLLTAGAGWRDWGVLQETPSRMIVRAFHASGMSGPFSGEDSYFTIDKRTWLPVHYEHRVYHYNSTAPPTVTEALDARYDVPIPASVAAPHLPPGVPLINTLAAPTDPGIPPVGSNVQRAHGLTVQVTPLAMDPQGVILVRVRAWLGNIKLGAEGSGTEFFIAADARHGKGDQAQDTPYHTGDGRRYIDFEWPQVPLGFFPGGATMLPLAPLEPRPSGMALPRSFTLDMVIDPEVNAPQESASQLLFEQGFVFTVPLPRKAAPIDIDAYLPRGYRQRFSAPPGLDASTVASNIAAARANEDENLHNPDSAIYWSRRSLAAVPPVTSTAQMCRLDLAGKYRHAGDDAQAAHWYREVIAVGRQRPRGWDHYRPLSREFWRVYAWQAQKALEYMHSHPSRSSAGNRAANGSRGG